MAYKGPSLTASGITFAQAQASGASGHLAKLAAAQAAISNPSTAPTVAATADGSSTLTTGTYYAICVETDGLGYTLPSPASTGQAITSGTNHLTITPHALQTGSQGADIYVSAVSNTGPWTLVATGHAATAFALSTPLPTNSLANLPLPAANSTGTSWVDANGVTRNRKAVALKAPEVGRIDAVYRDFARAYGEFNRGEPIAFADAVNSCREMHALALALATVAAEWGALLDANPGTFGSITTGIGGGKTKRTWP